MPQGYVVLVLHAHLPYVLSHGKWPHGSDWLCEATCETYIPLLNILNELSEKGKNVSLTIGITPVLCEMLAAPRFGSELKSYIGEKLQAAAHDFQTFAANGQDRRAELARMWQEFYEARLDDFTRRYKEDLLAVFRRLQDEGKIEIIVSAATHAYLPLLSLDTSIAAQVAQGVETYKKRFFKDPRGMWLPECAYRPEERRIDDRTGKGRHRLGLEAFLAAYGLEYFFIDNCLLGTEEASGACELEIGCEPDQASGVPSRQYEARRSGPAGDVWPSGGREPQFPERYPDLYAIHKTGKPESGECAFFTRDTYTSQQVWSGDWGYPADPVYLEFHKKHDPGGLRYWRVTDHHGDLGAKLPYDPDRAQERASVHAGHFKEAIEEKLRRYHEETGKIGVLALPFDAELFGHWWFEGIAWLSELISAIDENYVKIERASAVLQRIAPLGTVSLPEGSWGEGGFHLTWQNKETAWTWECVHRAERSMAKAVLEETDETGARILRQMARELLLLQASDWQFLITTKTAADYGKSRFLEHYNAFEDLRNMYDGYIKTRALAPSDGNVLRLLEERDAVFDNVNLEWFRERIDDGL